MNLLTCGRYVGTHQDDVPGSYDSVYRNIFRQNSSLQDFIRSTNMSVQNVLQIHVAGTDDSCTMLMGLHDDAGMIGVVVGRLTVG